MVLFTYNWIKQDKRYVGEGNETGNDKHEEGARRDLGAD